MVIFSRREDLAEKVSPEALKNDVIDAIEHSDAWRDHQKLHVKFGWDDAKLFVAEEMGLGGEKDFVRSRFGLAQKQAVSLEEVKKEEPSHLYGGSAHSGSGGGEYLGAMDPNRVGFSATCECGVNVSAQKDEDGQVKTTVYEVAASANKAATTRYETPSSSASVYSSTTTDTTYA